MDNMNLKNLVKTFLDKDRSYGELLNSARGLSEFFENFSPISTKEVHYKSNDSTHTYLSSGVAISPLDAAICTNEYMRTTKYIRGVYAAVNDLLNRFKNKKIHILYAGCGPYGTLIIPLLHLFDPKDMEITFLDIHTTSLESIKNILQSLGLAKFVCEYIQEDATQYKVSKDTHMIITETMKAAFWDEPQVSVTLNLLPQLITGGEFIPNRVIVGFEAAHYKQVFKDNILSKEKDGIYLCDVIDLDSSKDMTKESLVCTKEYTLLQNFEKKYKFQFTTDIFIYKEHILKENECSLNIPRKITFDKKLFKDDKVYFEYEFSNRPKIKSRVNIEKNELRDYIPQKVIYKNDEEKIVWYNMKNKRFTKPFFDDSFHSYREKKYTNWSMIKKVANSIDPIYPSGFIFHTSRCGSTLLSQLLACFEKNIVLSEAQLIHEALSIDHNKKISKEEKAALFKDTIKVLGQKRFAKEEKLFIKFDAWSIAELPFILELYPDLPWVFLYRDPIEVLVSHKRKRGVFTIPKEIKGKLFDQIDDTIHFDEYYKEVIYKIFETALQNKDLPKGMFINYSEIKSSVVDKIFPHFNLILSDVDIKKVNDRMNYDAKSPKDSFKDDREEKHNKADEDIKSFCNKNLLDIYKKLDTEESKKHLYQNKNIDNDTIFYKSLESGDLGILHLKFFWERKKDNSKERKNNIPQLNQLDYFVLDGLKIPIEDAVFYIYSDNPSFLEFENWILSYHNGSISYEIKKRINDSVVDFIENGQQDYPLETILKDRVFTREDMKFWEENGYIILKNAVDTRDCKELESAIWKHLELSPDEPQNWATAKDRFWLKEFIHPLLEKNRSEKKIQKAFSELWGTEKLFNSIDRVSFSPPFEDKIESYGPCKLHWDISLSSPVPFDLFGMLYLNDVEEEQGAFQCIPGFHKKLDSWLENLNKDIDPREEILKDEYQKEVVKISAKAGDFIISKEALPHGNSINRLDYPRFVHYITMYPPNRRIAFEWK